MAKITLRDIQLIYDRGTLTICSVDAPQQSIALDPGAVSELIDFVQSLRSRHAAVQQRLEDNGRESFRVPIVNPGDLRCLLTVAEKTFEAAAVNVSMTGVYLERRPRDPVELKIGDEVHVQLLSDDQFIELDAVVRRMGDDGYGLFFPCTLRGNTVAPPPEFRRLVMELQRRWMASRSDLPR
jgi:hypothetical protein